MCLYFAELIIKSQIQCLCYQNGFTLVMIGSYWHTWSSFFLLQIKNFKHSNNCWIQMILSSPFCTFTCWHATISKLARFFPTIHSANSNRNILQSLSSLHRCTVLLLLSQAHSYNREETAALILKETSTWNLTFTLMFLKTVSHVTFWASSSKKAGFVSYHLWSISLSYPSYCQPFLHCQSIVCSSIQRNAKVHFLGCVRLFSWCVHTLPKPQLQASTQPETCFPECFRLHHSRLTPQHTIQSSAS